MHDREEGLFFQLVKRKWRYAVIGGIGLVVSLALVAAGLAFLAPREMKMEAIKRTIRERFPEVKQLEGEALSAWLRDAADSEKETPQLLDVRTQEEYRVSHLPEATRVDPKATAREVLERLDPDRPTVVYCSVGYRSSRLAHRLQNAGYTNVFNLEGSIFEWANAGRPLEDENGGQTDVAHPYSSGWGHLLAEEHRASLQQ